MLLVELKSMAYLTQTREGAEFNRLFAEDLPVHEWYRFVLSFPPHLVRDCLKRFNQTHRHCVLDPFCGTGTTIVECKKLGIPSVGLEANPVAHFAAQTKTDWGVDPDALVVHAEDIAKHARAALSDVLLYHSPLFNDSESAPFKLRELSPDQQKLIILDSISPRPLHRVLTLLDEIDWARDDRFYKHERLVLAKQLVYTISNLKFGPEVGVSRIKKDDAPVVGPWLEGVRSMAADLKKVWTRRHVRSTVYMTDSRQPSDLLEDNSIDAVITSPPYPNEKDYSRTTRLESVLLGFLRSKEDLRRYKQGLLCSNTRNVYKDNDDDRWVANNARIQELADRIEARRIELGKTSGFERLYARAVRLYFGGLARHLEELKPKLRPGARLGYVVGDQASYFRVLIRTGEILAEVAQALGYRVEGIDLFRTRFATATQEQLREEIVLLRWE